MAGIVAHWAYRSLLAVGIPAKLYLSHRNDRIYAKSVGKRGVPASGVSHFYCHPAAGSGVILIDLVNMLRSACGPASASAGAVPASARWPRRARAVLTRAKKDRKGDSSKSQKSAAPPPEPKLSSAKPRGEDEDGAGSKRGVAPANRRRCAAHAIFVIVTAIPRRATPSSLLARVRGSRDAVVARGRRSLQRCSRLAWDRGSRLRSCSVPAAALSDSRPPPGRRGAAGRSQPRESDRILARRG